MIPEYMRLGKGIVGYLGEERYHTCVLLGLHRNYLKRLLVSG